MLEPITLTPVEHQVWIIYNYRGSYCEDNIDDYNHNVNYNDACVDMIPNASNHSLGFFLSLKTS